MLQVHIALDISDYIGAPLGGFLIIARAWSLELFAAVAAELVYVSCIGNKTLVVSLGGDIVLFSVPIVIF